MPINEPLDVTYGLYKTVEASLLEDKTTYDEFLVSVMQDNIYLARGIEKGFWLTRSRHMKNPDKSVPYICEDIGMKPERSPDKRDLGKRWGRMLYLNSDLSGRTARREIELPSYENATIGYFYVDKGLRLVNAKASWASSYADKQYGCFDGWQAMRILSWLIHDWFNADKTKHDSQVYRVTNHIAEIVRSCSDIDGILYQSRKNINFCNIA